MSVCCVPCVCVCFFTMEIICIVFLSRERKMWVFFFVVFFNSNVYNSFKIHGRCNTCGYNCQFIQRQIDDSYQTMRWFLRNQSNKCIILCIGSIARATQCANYHVMDVWLCVFDKFFFSPYFALARSLSHSGLLFVFIVRLIVCL